MRHFGFRSVFLDALGANIALAYKFEAGIDSKFLQDTVVPTHLGGANDLLINEQFRRYIIEHFKISYPNYKRYIKLKKLAFPNENVGGSEIKKKPAEINKSVSKIDEKNYKSEMAAIRLLFGASINHACHVYGYHADDKIHLAEAFANFFEKTISVSGVAGWLTTEDWIQLPTQKFIA